MRKKPIVLGIGILLLVLSLPLALAYTLHDEENVDIGDFEEEYEGDEYDTIYTYTFEKIGPGKITVSVRSILFSSAPVHVRIIDEDRSGKVMADYELEGTGLFWEDRSTDIDHQGDYTVWIGTYDEDYFEGDFKATYSARYSMFGLLSFILVFPIFLISGLVMIVVGAYSIYRASSKKEPEPGYEEEYSQFRVHDMRFTEGNAGDDPGMKEGVGRPVHIRGGSVRVSKDIRSGPPKDITAVKKSSKKKGVRSTGKPPKKRKKAVKKEPEE